MGALEMEFFFRPRGIAVVGATVKPKGGLAIVLNIIKGFSGGIYPVNPGYDEIAGLPCYARVLDVPDPVDLAIVFVPAAQVPDIAKQCAQRGIRGIMIESAGFAETGPQGEALQEEVKRIASAAGIRLWGPNCMGIVDTVSKHVFSFVSPSIWEELITGSVSLIVQSGMLSGGFLVDTMSHGTMGVSKVCSIGNKMDVNECDLLEYLLDDPDTGAVGLYLESIPQGRKFLSLCRKARKPIVVLKGGKSARGAEAAMSHTASLAGDARVISGVLGQAGVMEAMDFKQMLDLCRTLAMVPPPPPTATGRTAILTYSGGAGILSADFLDRLGLETARLSPETRETLKTVFPDWMPVKNPVDLWPAVEKNGAEKVYQMAVRAACEDPCVDAVLIHLYVGGYVEGLDLAEIGRVSRENGKPIFLWLLGLRNEAREFHMAAQDEGIVVFRELFRAVECIAAAFRPVRARQQRDG
jgi:acetyltransferase